MLGETTANRLEAAEREKIEIEYWRDSPTESPGADSLDNLFNKIGEARIFVAYVRALTHLLAEHGTVLELGAGQGWSSCLYKRHFPQAHIIATDLSPYAIASIDDWHRIFGVDTDRHYACSSYATAEPDGSVDLVYCFAAAHHFTQHAETLAEIRRILKPGGRALYIHEPVCSRLLYRWAYARVNAARHEVPEDLLLPAELTRMAEAAGLETEILRGEPLIGAWAFPSLNYRLQRLAPALATVLPSCATFVFTKR
jgi:SAM-dependent methyltransferase